MRAAEGPARGSTSAEASAHRYWFTSPLLLAAEWCEREGKLDRALAYAQRATNPDPAEGGDVRPTRSAAPPGGARARRCTR